MSTTDTTSGQVTAAAVRVQLLGSPAGRVVAVADTTGVTRRFTTTAFTDLAAGRVGVLARPGMRRTGWLAADLLRALGCRDDVTGAGRPGEGDWTLAGIWLKTHRVAHLYVQHAWTLPLPALEALLGAVEHTECVLWLVGDTAFTDRHREVLAPWTTVTTTGNEFINAWADISASHGSVPLRVPDEGATGGHAGDSAAARPEWPTHVPDDDFTMFRAACRDVLTDEQFTTVDAAFRRHVVVLRRAVAAMVTGGDLSEETVAALLAEHWETARSMAHYITVVRAAQVAFFLAGHYLQVDLDQLIGTATTMPRRALRSPATWARLHAYPEPHRGAVCALAAAGIAVDDMRLIAVGSYDPSTGTVATDDGRSVAVEPAARAFVEAQQHLRDRQGADASDPLFATRVGAPMSATALVTVINTARRELGVAVAPARQDRKAVSGDRWMTRWGVSLQELL
jgi:hypothetical protein